MAPTPAEPVTSAYTPWRHTSELAMVRGWLYPSYATQDPYSPQPPDMRHVAVQHVHMWSFKDPKLSHAIIATAALTDATLHDTWDRRKSISDWALRSIYAMAFCRFVNGFVDRDIAKAALRASAAADVDAAGKRLTGSEEGAGTATTTSRGESSMYAHAAAIGLPEHFVDLRHRATHEEMPSLQVLRQMAAKALDWLWERWWRLHATDNPDRALREREGRILVAQDKAEARRAHRVAQVTESELPSASSSQASVLEDENSRGRWTGAPRGDLFNEDLSGADLRRGKRKRDARDGAEVDQVPSQTRPGLDNDERLSRAKGKRKNLQVAFGLFESK